jgi:hypothetical protein
MTTVLNQSLNDIVENYADVIEGGNSYRGSGTAYRGIPGTYPNDPELRSGADTPQTVVGTSVSTTTFDVTGVSWNEDRWVKTNAPGYWALCNTAGDNFEQARKITAYNNTTKVFTVGSAFTAAPSAADSMVMLQGFKRLPNDVDIEAEETESPTGWDRFFSLTLEPGERLEYFGSGVETYITEMVLKLRILKKERPRDAVASAFENINILRSAIKRGANPDHRDGTYTRALWAKSGAEVVKDDQHKIVMQQAFQLVYRINSEFK